VAALLQRTGRTGRRPGNSRNCLFLTLGTGPLLWAAARLADIDSAARVLTEPARFTIVDEP
jgi:hypothetical protein